MLLRVAFPFVNALRRSLHSARLDDRGLIAVSGADAVSFLHGLVTNDINLLTEAKPKASTPSLYSLMLNVQGRVINDFTLYYIRNPLGTFPENTFLLDTDASLLKNTMAIFQKFRLRRKLEISDASEKYSQYALWNFKSGDKLQQLELRFEEVIYFGNDPRIRALGKRLIVPAQGAEITLQQMSLGLGENLVCDELAKEQWLTRRIQMGIPEGASDLPPGQCLPLESNADFMNGVSFSKGCYVGQELTARTHNIGVTRKRLLPIRFEGTQVKAGAKLFSETKDGLKPAGEVRSVCGHHGLGLVRLQYLEPSSNSAKLCVVDEANKSITALAYVSWPGWFPALKPILDKILV